MRHRDREKKTNIFVDGGDDGDGGLGDTQRKGESGEEAFVISRKGLM